MKEALILKEYQVSLTDQIVEDLINFKFDKNFESDRKLRDFFTANSKVNGRAVTRILNRETTLPAVETVYQIYSTILDTSKYNEVLEKAPRVVSKFISDYSHKNTIQKDNSEVSNRYLFENQLAMKLYFKCSGHGISLEEIKRKHGEDGFEEILNMQRLRIVEIDSDSHVKLGTAGLSLNIARHGEISAFLIKNFYRPNATLKKGSNFISNRWESVSPQAYNELINTLEEAVTKIGKIIKKDDLEKPSNQQTKKFCLTTFIDEIE